AGLLSGSPGNPPRSASRDRAASNSRRLRSWTRRLASSTPSGGPLARASATWRSTISIRQAGHSRVRSSSTASGHSSSHQTHGLRSRAGAPAAYLSLAIALAPLQSLGELGGPPAGQDLEPAIGHDSGGRSALPVVVHPSIPDRLEPDGLELAALDVPADRD